MQWGKGRNCSLGLNEVAFVACLSLYRISKRDMVGTSIGISLAGLVLKKILVGLVIHFHMIWWLSTSFKFCPIAQITSHLGQSVEETRQIRVTMQNVRTYVINNMKYWNMMLKQEGPKQYCAHTLNNDLIGKKIYV